MARSARAASFDGETLEHVPPFARDRSDSSGSLPTRAAAPPSSFNFSPYQNFPFQSHPGNPDPGTPYPRYSYGLSNSRRSSLDSLTNAPISFSASKPSASGLPAGAANPGFSPTYPPPTPPEFPRTSTPPTPTREFRAPFLSPSSRASLTNLSRPGSFIWTPPSYPVASPAASSTALNSQLPPTAGLRASTKLPGKLTTDDKPWLATHEPRARLSYAVTAFCMFLGLAGAAVVCFFGVTDVQSSLLDEKRLCPVMDENFNSASIDEKNWGWDVGYVPTGQSIYNAFRPSEEGFTGGASENLFNMFTKRSENSFIRDGKLWIVPTVTSRNVDDLTRNNATFRIDDCTPPQGFVEEAPEESSDDDDSSSNSTETTSASGRNTATSGSRSSTARGPASTANANVRRRRLEKRAPIPKYLCTVAASALTNRVIPPAQSARLTTRSKKVVDGARGGRISVRAKVGHGEWVSSRIGLEQELTGDARKDANKGEGEMELLHIRHSGPEYGGQGHNFARSSVAFNPMPDVASLRESIFGWQQLKRGGYGDDFHTYTVEWNTKFVRFFVDNRLKTTLHIPYRNKKNSIFSRGKYGAVASNATTGGASSSGGGDVVVKNRWEEEERGFGAPFDTPFYLTLAVEVGGTNGWYPDRFRGSDGSQKPWTDRSTSQDPNDPGAGRQMGDFARSQGQWEKTWPENVQERGLGVEFVKMWQVC